MAAEEMGRVKMCIRDSLQAVQQAGKLGRHIALAPATQVGTDDGHHAAVQHRAGPVSYTHLDVYKRQSFICAASALPVLQPDTLSGFAPPSPVPTRYAPSPKSVSYTHLIKNKLLTFCLLYSSIMASSGQSANTAASTAAGCAVRALRVRSCACLLYTS